MNRRDALCSLAATAVTPLIGNSWADLISLGRRVHGELAERTSKLQTLGSHQLETVRVLSELIIPETDTPGASTARVHEFIDLILSEWMDEAEASAFLVGLAEVDTRCRESWGRSFVECEPSTQQDLMKIMDREVAVLLEQNLAAVEHFFYQLKRWVLTGYFTSGAGMAEALDYVIWPGSFDGCVH